MVSSNGVVAVEGVGNSDCARTGDNAVTSPRKSVINRKFTEPTVLATLESTSGTFQVGTRFRRVRLFRYEARPQEVGRFGKTSLPEFPL